MMRVVLGCRRGESRRGVVVWNLNRRRWPFYIHVLEEGDSCKLWAQEVDEQTP